MMGLKGVSPFAVLHSPLAWRLLLVNLLAPVLLVAGLFYMDHYRQGLIDADIKTLKAQAELMALAVSEGAVNVEFSASVPPASDRTAEQGYFSVSYTHLTLPTIYSV